MVTEPGILSLVLPAYLAAVIVMAGLWALQLRIRNASIADVGWCLSLIAVVLWYVSESAGEFERKLLAALLVVLYAGRSGPSILFNRVLGKQEDARYRRVREQWGLSEPVRMFWYFQLQALAVAAFSLPFLALIQNPQPPFAPVERLGLMIWCAAIFGEARADRQLALFRADPRNHDRVCREGLWRYSRHPNYFFEWLHWWAYVVMASDAPGWWLTWIGPVAMGWALVKITGIPHAEAQALATRGEDYRQYQRTTSAFFPWPPRSE
jgi:steroid 5-alpha reductase family enzyme